MTTLTFRLQPDGRSGTIASTLWCNRDEGMESLRLTFKIPGVRVCLSGAVRGKG